MAIPTAKIHIPGAQVIQQDVYLFVCPVCRKVFRHDDRYEPMCTGPSESRNEHEPTVMVCIGSDPRRVQV